MQHQCDMCGNHHNSCFFNYRIFSCCSVECHERAQVNYSRVIIDINPASLLGKDKRKTMTPAAIVARQINGSKGGRPKKPKNSVVKDQI